MESIVNKSKTNVLIVGEGKALQSIMFEYINHASELPPINIQESDSLQLDVSKETSDE